MGNGDLQRSASSTPAAGRIKILIVDDDASVRASLCRLLSTEHFETIPVKGGEEALALLDSEKVSIVLLDIFMPDKDGLEVLGEIRRKAPDVKVITMSGHQVYRGMDVLGWSARLGAAAILLKPFGRDDLVNVIASALGQP